MKRYLTHNIDEAAYYALQGYSFSVKRTAAASALFSFEEDRKFAEVRRCFWKGEATVLLHRWLASRTALKHEVWGQAIVVERAKVASTDASHDPFMIRAGTPYWYRDGAKVEHTLFGHSDTHASRLAEGNFYRTKDDAMFARNPIRAL